MKAIFISIRSGPVAWKVIQATKHNKDLSAPAEVYMTFQHRWSFVMGRARKLGYIS